MRTTSIRCAECEALNTKRNLLFGQPREYLTATKRTRDEIGAYVFAIFLLGFGFGAAVFAVLENLTQ